MAERRATDASLRVEGTLHNLGITASEKVMLRLVLLDRFTPTVDDERRSIDYARKVFDRADTAGHPFSESEKTAVTVGTLFTDIGKAGPKDANPEQAKLIVSMYAVENITSEDVSSNIENFFAKYFKTNHEELLTRFSDLALDPHRLTMRDFYNLHTSWTLDLLEDSDLPTAAILAAASHHRLRGDNPRGIFVGDEDTYDPERFPGETYGRAQKLVTLLDQYDAFRRRSGQDHDVATNNLRELMHTTRGGRYANDDEYAQLIEDIDESLKTS